MSVFKQESSVSGQSMKRLLPQGVYFKANLHTHTTVSDGDLTPEQTKEMYKAKGYQVVAFTDHNVTADHSYLNDESFLALTGNEVNVNAPNDDRSYHLNLLAKRPDNHWSPVSVVGKYPGAAPYEALMVCEGMEPVYAVDSINALIQKANDNGFLVTYNHPTWSLQSYPDYANLRGLWGVEIRNYACYKSGYDENNRRVYRDLLSLGNRLFPIGADDTHSAWSAGGSWVMIAADTLSYEAVIAALEQGDFYMSCGPEITELTMEDGVVTVCCSKAVTVNLETPDRFALRAECDGEPLCRATFDIRDYLKTAKDDAYFYVTVTAANDTYAVTRPYYINEK